MTAHHVIYLLAALLACTAAAQELPDCSGDVQYFPHPDNCPLYYSCVDGVLILQQCPPSLWWNPVKEECDWPSDAGCAAAPTTTTTTFVEPRTEAATTSDTETPTPITKTVTSSTETTPLPTETTTLATETSSSATARPEGL